MNDNNDTIIEQDISFTFDEFIRNKEEIIESYPKFKIEKMWPNTDDSITYTVVNNDAEMTNELRRLNYKVSQGGMYFLLRLEGIIVNFPIKDLSNEFLLQIDNVIFLHDVTLSSSLKSKNEYKNIQVIWNNCYFLDSFLIQTFDWNSLIFENSKFYEKVFIANLKLNSFEIRNCTFNKDASISNSSLGSMDLSYINAQTLKLDYTKTQYNCNLENINAEEINLEGSNISKKLSILNSKINKEYKLNLSNVFCENFVFRSSGKISSFDLADFVVEKRSNIDLNCIKSNLYSCLYHKNNDGELDYKLTLNSIESLMRFNSFNDETEEKLDLIYIQKKIKTSALLFDQRKIKESVKNIPKWLGNVLIEKTSKYFTCWKRSLLTIGAMIVIFAIIYGMFPHKILQNNLPIADKNIWELIVSLISDNSQYNRDILFRTIGRCGYFSMITFTTIGYGDISPSGGLKIVAGLEGLLGVMLVAIFITCLTRKYVN